MLNSTGTSILFHHHAISLCFIFNGRFLPAQEWREKKWNDGKKMEWRKKNGI